MDLLINISLSKVLYTISRSRSRLKEKGVPNLISFTHGYDGQSFGKRKLKIGSDLISNLSETLIYSVRYSWHVFGDISASSLSTKITSGGWSI